MTDTATGQTRTATLGAFKYWPASASRIEGLGGKVVDPDPSYAFHTQYTELGQGVVRATIRFVGLEASMGLITLRVNGLPPVPGARAETVRTWSASLPEMAEGEGVVEMSFQASAGSRYAVLGQIYTETDARARDLEIVLVTTLEDASDQRAATRKSIFGRRVFRRSNRMFRNTPPTLSDPVCQAFTGSQLGESAYRRWLSEMSLPDAQDRGTWQFAYILQVLSRYGMLRPGARGLGLGVGVERLPAVMASHGCTVLATALPATGMGADAPADAGERAGSIESLRFPQICADEVFDRQVGFRTVDVAAIPADLSGFDFTWSSRMMQSRGSIEAGLAFVRDSVGCLTFGGLAVHTTELNLSSNEDTAGEGESVLFRKRDLERMAVDLVSRGHYVAQFNYDLGTPASASRTTAAVDGYATTSFGIIVRRGDR